MVNERIGENTNGYCVKSFEIKYNYDKPSSNFALKIRFERHSEGIFGILINYHLMSGMLVLVASINFLFDPKDTNRSCLLVALLLVFITIFTAAQVT